MPRPLRNIAAVVLGYLAAVVTVFLALTFAWFLLGPEGAFEEGSYNASAGWLFIMLLSGVGAAIIAGVVTAKLAAAPRGATIALATLFVVFGAAQLVRVIAAPAPDDTARPAGITMTQAMDNARQPVWFAVVNPIVGVSGVIIGANAVARRAKTPAE